MVRTHIRLTELQARKLKQLAAARGRSTADLIRASVDAMLARAETVDAGACRVRAIAAAGAFRSGTRDLASAHDRHLAEAFQSAPEGLTLPTRRARARVATARPRSGSGAAAVMADREEQG